MLLYHAQIGFPPWFKAPTHTIKPRYGSHSFSEAQIDRYGRIELPKVIDLSKYKVIEIGIEGTQVVKMLIRGQLDACRDICLVLSGDFVKTVWVNMRLDSHRTLDRSKYSVPRKESKC